MPSKIILKKSSVASKVPVAGDLDFGELAINYTDSKLYFKKADGSIDAFTSSAAAAPVTSVGGYTGVVTATNLLNAIKTVDGTGSGLDADTLDGLSSASFYLASNPNGYTSNLGTVTNVGATSPVVSSGGTTPTISMPSATASANGYMTAAYASKLDGIAAGATNVTNTNQLTNGAGYITSAALASYLPLTGGTLNGILTANGGIYAPKIGIASSNLADQVNGAPWYGLGFSDLNFGAAQVPQFAGYYGLRIRTASTIMDFAPNGDPGNINVSNGGFKVGGNVALHAGNYSSYALPLSGGTISSGGAYPLQLQTTQRYGLRVYNTSVAGSGWWLANDANTLAFHADGVGDRASLNSDGVFITTGSFRAPLFYDSNDTGYYIDPNSYSRIRQLTVTQARVDSSKYPVGHYTSGQEVFSIDPTWSQDQLREYFNSNSISWVADSTAPGGYAISISGNVNVGGAMGSGFPFIPVETDDTFYMEVYVKDVSGTNTHYMGSVDFNESFGNLGGNPGSYGYWVMANNGPGTGWTKYSGYISGFGTSTGSFKSGTKYWTPQALFNYTGGGTSYISGWRVYRLAKGIVGRFPNGTVNNGEAWFGRANDRARGTYTVQLGGGSSSGRTFEVVDYAWTDTLFSVNSANYASASGSFRAPIFYDSHDTGYYVDPTSTGVSLSSNGIVVSGTGTAGGFQNRTFTSGRNRIWSFGNADSYGLSYFQGSGGYNSADSVGIHFGSASAAGSDFTFATSPGGTFIASGSVRSPIFYDSQNTAYFTDPAGRSRQSQIDFGDGGYYIHAGSWGMRNTTPYGYIEFGPANSGHAHIYTDRSNFYFNAQIQVLGGSNINQSDIRANIFYDANDTSYYTDQNSTSSYYRINVNNNILFTNYGRGMVGTYSASRYQAVFAMGDSYKLPDDGTSTGSLYGIAWSHPNAGGTAGNLNTHGALILENGSFLAALSGSIRSRDDMRTPIFYDSNNTGYYLDPNSVSYLYGLTLAGGSYFRPQNWIQFDGSYGLYWPNHYGAHLHANDLSTYTQIALRGSKNSYGGIYDQYSGVNIGMYDSSGNGGLYREGSGRWFQYYHVGNDCTGFGTSSTSSAYNIYAPKGIYSGGRVDGTIFYDSNNTGYYVDPNSTTYLYYLQSATTVRADSDRRLKENIVPITGALAKVRLLQGCTYTRNDLADKTKVYMGMIAQDVLPVVPEVVSGSEKGKYSLGYAELVPLLNEAIKEQDLIIQSQEARIKRLESLIEKLI